MTLDDIIAEDISGEDSIAVGKLYLKAFSCSPITEKLILYYICFLVTISSYKFKLVWNQYSKDLSTDSKLEIIRLLAARAEIRFAIEIVNSITEKSSRISRTKEYLEHLRLAQDEYCIFPWNLNPFTAWSEVHLHKEPVRRAFCGRVTFVRDDAYEICYGALTNDKRTYLLTSIHKDDIALELDDFVEIAERLDGCLSVLKFEKTEWPFEKEMEPTLDSRRYLKKWFEQEKKDDS